MLHWNYILGGFIKA